MTRRYYHLLSDGKTVKEITRERYVKLVWKPSLVIVRSRGWIHVRKDKDYVTVPLRQLETIFANGIKEERRRK